MLVLLFFVATALALCNQHDVEIYNQKGTTFQTVFRTFGGMFVSQESYERTIVDQMGLSASCARCYGDAYTCGYSNCKMSCAWAGSSCDTCLADHQCSQVCNQCTGFI